jgi:hypothetical protein
MSYDGLLSLKPTLYVGRYAFVDEGSVTTLYDLDTKQPLLYLNSVGEYALARMLMEKTQEFSVSVRAQGEKVYQEQVTPVGRLSGLS